MNTTDARFAGSVPALYERYLVPLLFQQYAEDLAARFADLESGRVLEIAAGTGAVTRALVKALPSTVNVVATDLNEGMLSVAKSLISAPSLSWRLADAQKLPFEDGSFEAMVCQFGVMFLPDRRAGYREAWRVLRSGGRYVFSVWNRVEQNEVTAIADRALAERFPGDPSRFVARAPFGYFDVAVIRADLESAGFRRIEIETLDKVSQASSATDTALGLCQGTPLRGEIEAREPNGLSAVTAAVTSALVARFGEGSFDNRMSAHVVTAWRT